MQIGVGLGVTAGGKTGPSYLGPVATSTYFPDNVYTSGGAVGHNSWTAHWATQDVSYLQLVFVNAMANTTLGGAGAVTEHTSTLTNNVLTCIIEYPAGVYTRVKKNGANAMNLAIGATLITDGAAVSIPNGAKFIIHSYWERQGGGQPSVAGTYYIGTGVLSNEATPNDRTGTFSLLGTATDWAAFAWQIGPQAILSSTTKRTFALIGDSRTIGTQDGKTDANKGCTGEVARAINTAGHGMLNLGVGNDRMVKYIADHALRIQLANYCSEVVLGFGANDIFFDSAATMLTNAQAIRAYFPGKPAYLYTIPPVGVTSTDNYATLVNQTAHGVNAVRVPYNALLRAGVSGFVRTWEIGDVLESARDSGKWRVDIGLVTGNTASGDPTHESALGNSAIASSGAIIL